MNQTSTCALKMPRACVSCTHYTAEGFDNDAHCPFKSDAGQAKARTPYGQCSLNKKEVFCTEICSSYQCEPGVQSYQVNNRPEPRQPIQSIKRQSPSFYPKAGRCRGCTKLHDDCSALPFESMPVHRSDGIDAVVICTEFEQLNYPERGAA